MPYVLVEEGLPIIITHLSNTILEPPVMLQAILSFVVVLEPLIIQFVKVIVVPPVILIVFSTVPCGQNSNELILISLADMPAEFGKLTIVLEEVLRHSGE